MTVSVILVDTSVWIDHLRRASPALTWVLPFANDCVSRPTDRLTVAASSTTKPTKVVFRYDGKVVGTDRSGPDGVWAVTWRTKSLNAPQ